MYEKTEGLLLDKNEIIKKDGVLEKKSYTGNTILKHQVDSSSLKHW